ncbi:MAG: hypothetical protein OES24_12865 [Acidimicrobiia bacterium]|nr:hypothetical protein [Acidimicrobiia bacterium]
MNQATVPSPDEAFVAPTLTRPTLTRPMSAARRLRGRLDRLRLAWRRVAIATGTGLLAAGVTVAWLSARSTPPFPAHRSTEPADDPLFEPESATGQPPKASSGRAELDENLRILALDRSTIALPVSVGSVVEVLGLRPTVADVQAEVITARADVVGMTDEAILVAVDADAAYTAAEIAAVGRVTILGRDVPAG